MANVYTDLSSGVWQNLAAPAYDRAVDYQLRNMPLWRQFAVDKHPAAQAMPGSTVTLTILNEFSGLATTPLTETVDPDAVAPPNPTRVTITPNEYGNAALQTRKLRDLSFTQPDMELANLIGKNEADTIDSLIQAVVDASTNLLFVNGGVLKTSAGSEVTVGATDVYSSAAASAAVSLLRRRKTTPKDGTFYLSVIHPDVSLDLRRENATNAWIAPHTYGGDTAQIYAGEIGAFAGQRYIETTRVRTALDGVTSGKVYSTYTLAQQAVAELTVEEPHVVIGNQTDKLNRFFPIGWYAVLGWGIYRPEAIQVTRTASSIATL